MKNIFSSIIFFIFSIVESFAQNLVINPGFEDTLQCPFFVSQIDFATNWQTSVNTPDYYNACNNNGPVNPGMVGVPYSARGFQPARNGDAFAGVVIYWTAQTNYREIFYAQLASPLSAGVIYNAGMFVILNEDNAMWAVDGGLGIYLSTVPVNPFTPFIYTPQISNPTGNVLNDTLNWTEISGTFTAAGGEQYITIGSFIPDNQLTILNRGGTYPFTSYAIEDVWVFPDSLTGISTLSNQSFKNEIFVYPNPSKNFIYLTAKEKIADLISIRDFSGREVLIFHPEKFSSKRINIGKLEAGIYLLRAGSIVKKFIVE